MDPLISRNPDFFKTVNRTGVRPRQLVYSTLETLTVSGSGTPDLVHMGSDTLLAADALEEEADRLDPKGKREA